LPHGGAGRSITPPARWKEAEVRIEVRGKNVEVTDELREAVVQRFQRVGRQVSEFATLEVELCEEKNPRISDRMVAEATLGLKRVTLRAKEASPDMLHSIHELAEDIRRQVKKHREKRRKRHRTRKIMQRLKGETA
jgi:ribosome hibernation promoting factor